MNKRIFTLLTAGLLLGGPAFNAAYAATDLTTKTVISYSENKTALANGMSFYLAYIIHSGFISGYQNRYGDNLKPPTNVYHRMTA